MVGTDGEGVRRLMLGLEIALAAAIVAGAACAVWFLAGHGYLPQPFYHDPSQSLMDLYNTAYWAHRPGAYDVWGSVYPPAPFILLRLLTDGRCYTGSPYAARLCDHRAALGLLTSYAACWPLLALWYARLDRATAPMRTLATGLALPLLYGLERGNLIVPSFALLMAAIAVRPRSRAAHHLLSALSFNLKPYAAIVLMPLFPLRRWDAIAAYVAVFMAIYLGSCVAMGGGWPLQLLRNVQLLVRHTGANSWNNIYYATTYNQFAAALQNGFASQLGVPPPMVTPLCVGARVLVLVGQIGVLACYGLGLLRRERVVVTRFMAIALLFVLTTWGSSGYASIYLFPLVFRERFGTTLTAIVVICAYLLCLPADLVLRPMYHELTDSYLGGRLVFADHGLALGQLVRPGLLLAIEYALVALVLADLGFAPGASGDRVDAPGGRAVPFD